MYVLFVNSMMYEQAVKVQFPNTFRGKVLTKDAATDLESESI